MAPASPGYFKITICSSRSSSYVAPIPSANQSASCNPYDDPGGPGDTVTVTVDFDHPLIVPFISAWWPQLHLTAERAGIVEQFRVSRLAGVPPTLSPPSPTYTPRPTDTPTLPPTETPIPSDSDGRAVGDGYTVRESHANENPDGHTDTPLQSPHLIRGGAGFRRFRVHRQQRESDGGLSDSLNPELEHGLHADEVLRLPPLRREPILQPRQSLYHLASLRLRALY